MIPETFDAAHHGMYLYLEKLFNATIGAENSTVEFKGWHLSEDFNEYILRFASKPLEPDADEESYAFPVSVLYREWNAIIRWYKDQRAKEKKEAKKRLARREAKVYVVIVEFRRNMYAYSFEDANRALQFAGNFRNKVMNAYPNHTWTMTDSENILCRWETKAGDYVIVAARKILNENDEDPDITVI